MGLVSPMSLYMTISVSSWKLEWGSGFACAVSSQTFLQHSNKQTLPGTREAAQYAHLIGYHQQMPNLIWTPPHHSDSAPLQQKRSLLSMTWQRPACCNAGCWQLGSPQTAAPALQR